MNEVLKIVDCPRDAMQGMKGWIPTDKKAEYINQLMQVGFNTLDCLSFVSPKAVPQMADSKEVAALIDSTESETAILAIVLNKRGADDAAAFDHVRYLGFPFSISETFQQRNGNSSIAENWERLMQVNTVCQQQKKKPVVYLSMGFGNPYGDQYSPEMVNEWIAKLKQEGFGIISIADTVGVATAEEIFATTKAAVDEFQDLEIGVHLHGTKFNWVQKVEAAYRAGCRRFDGAIGGFGGCPMAGDDLVGNLDTVDLVDYFAKAQLPEIREEELTKAKWLAVQLFSPENPADE